MEYFSVFNIAGDCKINGLSIVAENVGYIIHDDIGIVSTSPSHAEFINNKLTHNGTTYTPLYSAPICIGGGTSAAMVERVIQNNVFTSPRPNTVNYHTSSGGFGVIAFKDNIITQGSFRGNLFGGGSYRLIICNNKLQTSLSIDPAIDSYDWNNLI